MTIWKALVTAAVALMVNDAMATVLSEQLPDLTGNLSSSPLNNVGKKEYLAQKSA